MSENQLNKIFKAFIITKNKVPRREYTNPENQYKYDQIKGMPEYAGILSQDAVLVDIDDGQEAEVMLRIIKELKVQCRVHKTTRGMHAFFIGHHLPSTKTKYCNAIGLNTDYKLGEKNGISILKMDGKEREVLYETAGIGPLPPWLYPVSKMVPEFLKMGDGDGRNQALFEYILTLQSAGLTKDESRETIQIINRFIFKEPLPDREIDTILRDKAFPTESFYDNKGRLQYRKFEEHFCREVHAIKLDKTLHIYRDGVYVAGEEMIRGKMLEYLPDLSFSQRNEIMNRSKDRIQTMSKRAPAYLIAFRNGVYDTRNGSITSHNPENIITNFIDWNYRADAYSEIVDKTLNKLACQDPTVRALMEEIIGYCFYRRNELGKGFLFLGNASNGKSTYLDLIRHILGYENISSLNLQELNQKFKPAELFNKMANIGDDIPDTWVPDPSMFKKVVTGDMINVERKNGHPFEFFPYAKMLFSANEMPRIDDKTGAVKRRLVPVPFKAVFSPDDPDFDPYIKDKLLTEESIEYLIKLGIDGLQRVLTRNKFSTNAEIEKELKDIDELNNPLIGFIEEIGVDAILNHSTKSVYDQYRMYCIECGMKEVARNSFVRQINARLGTTTIRKMVKGESNKIFVPKEGRP